VSAWPRAVRYLRVPIYDQNVYLVFDRKVAERCHAYLQLSEPWPISGAGFACAAYNDDGTCCHVVAVFDGGLPTLIHELSHLTWNILRRVGVKVKPTNNEAYAYLIEWLYAQTAPMLPKRGRK